MRPRAALPVLLPALLAARLFAADFEVGPVELDLSIAVESITWHETEGEETVARNEQALELGLHTDPDQRWQVVTALDLVAGAIIPRVDLEGSGVVEQEDNYQVRSDAAYLDLKDMFLDGLDVRIGRQVVTWGVADVFNPTDVLSSKSFEDPTKFGKNLPDPAVNVSWHVADFNINAVYVDRFQAPRLPPDLARQLFSSGRIPPAFQDLADDFFANGGELDLDLRAQVPSEALWGLRVTRPIGQFDVSVCYADTRESVPVLKDLDVKSFDPVGYTASVDADIYFPKKKVYGLDFTGQLPMASSPGLWFEAAWTVPEPSIRSVTLTGAKLSEEVILDEPYLKYTAGADYTFRSGYLLTGQLVRGFVDENEKPLLDTYIVAGFEKSFFTDALRVRLFENYDVSDGGFLVTPDLNWFATDHVEVGLGGIYYGGKADSKLAKMPSGHQLYLRMRYAF